MMCGKRNREEISVGESEAHREGEDEWNEGMHPLTGIRQFSAREKYRQSLANCYNQKRTFFLLKMHKKRLARASIQRCPDRLLDLREPLCSREGQGRNGSRQARDKGGEEGSSPNHQFLDPSLNVTDVFAIAKEEILWL